MEEGMVQLPKVLVIDNGALYCQAVRELLEPSEAKVFVAQDVASARVLLNSFSPIYSSLMWQRPDWMG